MVQLQIEIKILVDFEVQVLFRPNDVRDQSGFFIFLFHIFQKLRMESTTGAYPRATG